MPGVLDNNLMFRTDLTELTAIETSAWLDIGGTGVRGMTARVMVPSASGSTPTLDVTLQSSTDGTNADAATLATVPQITAAGSYEKKFATMRRYVRMVFTIGSATTNPVFGVVEAGINIDSRDYVRPPV